MKFQVIKLKKGYAVQNTQTMTIISTYSTQIQAQTVVNKLNGVSNA